MVILTANTVFWGNCQLSIYYFLIHIKSQHQVTHVELMNHDKMIVTPVHIMTVCNNVTN